MSIRRSHESRSRNYFPTAQSETYRDRLVENQRTAVPDQQLDGYHALNGLRPPLAPSVPRRKSWAHRGVMAACWRLAPERGRAAFGPVSAIHRRAPMAAPGAFFLFAKRKDWLHGRRFSAAVLSPCSPFPTAGFEEGFARGKPKDWDWLMARFSERPRNDRS